MGSAQYWAGREGGSRAGGAQGSPRAAAPTGACRRRVGLTHLPQAAGAAVTPDGRQQGGVLALGLRVARLPRGAPRAVPGSLGHEQGHTSHPEDQTGYLEGSTGARPSPAAGAPGSFSQSPWEGRTRSRGTHKPGLHPDLCHTVATGHVCGAVVGEGLLGPGSPGLACALRSCRPRWQSRVPTGGQCGLRPGHSTSPRLPFLIAWGLSRHPSSSPWWRPRATLLS